RFFRAFNAGFTDTTDRYLDAVKFLIGRKWIAGAGLAVVFVAVFIWTRNSPTGFIPTEDQGFIVYSVNLPPGASLVRTQKVMVKIDDILADIEAIERRASIAGLNIVANANSSNYGVGFIRMKPHGERGAVDNIQQVMGLINQRLSTIKEASVFLFEFPTVQGFGNTSGFEFIIQDRTGGDLNKLAQTAYGFIGELMKREEIAYAFTTFNTGN